MSIFRRSRSSEVTEIEKVNEITMCKAAGLLIKHYDAIRLGDMAAAEQFQKELDEQTMMLSPDARLTDILRVVGPHYELNFTYKDISEGE